MSVGEPMMAHPAGRPGRAGRGIAARRLPALAVALILLSPPLAAQDPLAVRLAQSDTTWIVTEPTTIDLLLTADSAGDGLVLDSLRLDLPADLRCGSRGALPVYRFDGGIMGPGSVARVSLAIPDAGGNCTRLLDELGRTSVSGSVWYDDLATERAAVQPFTVTVAWRAGALLILAGALLGVLTSGLFRFVAGKAGHREALFPEGRSPAWGLALNILTAAIVVALIRLLPEGQLPAPFRALVADTFGSGFLLGLISNALVVPLLNLVLKGEGVLPKSGGSPPAEKPDEARAIEV